MSSSLKRAYRGGWAVVGATLAAIMSASLVFTILTSIDQARPDFLLIFLNVLYACPLMAICAGLTLLPALGFIPPLQRGVRESVVVAAACTALSGSAYGMFLNAVFEGKGFDPHSAHAQLNLLRATLSGGLAGVVFFALGTTPKREAAEPN